MSKLTTAERNALPDSDFAYIDKSGGRHLPIEDKSHVQDAIARFGQTHFDSPEARKSAAQKILAAAKKDGIHVNPDDEVVKAAES